MKAGIIKSVFSSSFGSPLSQWGGVFFFYLFFFIGGMKPWGVGGLKRVSSLCQVFWLGNKAQSFIGLDSF
jgi:hypothetical protein